MAKDATSLPRFREDPLAVLYRRNPLLPGCSACPLNHAPMVRNGKTTIYSLCRAWDEQSKTCAYAKSWYWSEYKHVREQKPDADPALVHQYCSAVALREYLGLQVYAFGTLGKDGKPTEALKAHERATRQALAAARAIGIAKSSGNRASDGPKYDASLFGQDDDADD